MRNLFEDIFAADRPHPIEAARRAMRPRLKRRFYQEVGVVTEIQQLFSIRLDGRPVRTPARQMLAAPVRPLAQAIAAEWESQGEWIDSASMPLTRLANSIIDGVVEKQPEVAAEVEKYLGSDLLFYRAEAPAALVSRQAQHWDPIVAWIRDAHDAHFVLTHGVTFVAQPAVAIAAARTAIPDDAWRLGAVHAVATLTGSALIALALAADRLSIEAAWAAAHVDEDWNEEQWGADALAVERRGFRLAEMKAAAAVLAHLR